MASKVSKTRHGLPLATPGFLHRCYDKSILQIMTCITTSYCHFIQKTGTLIIY